MAREDEFRNGQRVRVERFAGMESFEGVVDNDTDLMVRASNPIVRVRADGGWHEVYDKQYVTATLLGNRTNGGLTVRDGRMFQYGQEVVRDGSDEVWTVEDYDRTNDMLELGQWHQSPTGFRSEWISASRVTPHRRTVSGNTGEAFVTDEARADLALGTLAILDDNGDGGTMTIGPSNVPTHPFAGIGLTPQAVAILNALTAVPGSLSLDQTLALAVLMGDAAAANALVDRLIEAREAGQ